MTIAASTLAPATIAVALPTSVHVMIAMYCSRVIKISSDLENGKGNTDSTPPALNIAIPQTAPAIIPTITRMSGVTHTGSSTLTSEVS